LIGGGLLLLVSFTFFAYSHHDISSFSPSSALALIKSLPHAQLFALLKDALILAAFLGAILAVGVLFAYNMYKDRHAGKDNVSQVMRRQWARYDDVQKFAGSSQLYTSAHVIRRDIVPKELPDLPERGAKSHPATIAGYPAPCSAPLLATMSMTMITHRRISRFG
jgi:hypothetical protein